VLVADDGTVLALDGPTVTEGRVGARGTQPYDGLSPERYAELALG
jgi:hypothetical protein